MKHVVYSGDAVNVKSYANLILLERLYARLEQRRWNRERKAFLTEELAKNGKLTCYYCDNDGLKLKTVRRCLQATVDHFIAKANGGSEWDKSNFVVSCNSCNKKKGTRTAEEFKNSKYIKIRKLQNHE